VGAHHHRHCIAFTDGLALPLIHPTQAELCLELTATFWKNYERHPWTEAPHVDDRINQLGQRIEEVLNVRSQHEQLIRLLTGEEQEALGTSTVFSAFDALQPLHYNPYTESLWRAGVTEYERKMQPAENVIAGKLRSQFKELEGSSSQLVREFQRYKLLVARPNISRELISERETLLAQLSAQMTALKGDFNERSTGSKGAPAGKNMPKTVGGIVWGQQLLAKAEEILTFAQSLFSDLGGMEAFAADGEDFIGEVASYQKQQFADWSSSVTEDLNDDSGDGGLLLETTGRLMDFEHSDGTVLCFFLWLKYCCSLMLCDSERVGCEASAWVIQ
jgi:dynein heavy chain 2